MREVWAMDDPIFAPAHELATAIRRREVSSSEVVDAHLAQIVRHTPRLNAVVVRLSSSRRASTARDCLSGCRCWAVAGTTSGSWRSPNCFRNSCPDFGDHPVTDYSPECVEGWGPTKFATAGNSQATAKTTHLEDIVAL